jgi:hypothetical protein
MFDMLKRMVRSGESFGEPEYRVFQLRDKNLLAGTTKIREISAPNEAMEVICRMFYGVIRLRLAHLKVRFPYGTAILPGSSPLKNVLRHVGNRYFYLLDIKDFYLGISGEQIVPCLLELMPNFAKRNDLTEFLDKYCLSEEKVLRMGAPASPDLANIVADCLLDEPLSVLVGKYGMTYSRYLDDLTFSSRIPIGKRKKRAIRDIILGSGFKISSKKSVYADISKKPITITGIGLMGDGRIFLKRSFLKKILGLLCLIETNKVPIRINHRTGREIDPFNVVNGLVAALWSTIPAGGRELNALEKEIIRKYLIFRERVRERKDKPSKPTGLEKRMRMMV